MTNYFFDAYHNMKKRCYNKKHPKYRLYGARGIIVCSRWLNSFELFKLDMGERPSNQHSLDRINNDGNYEPSNCKWSTRSEQMRNRRNYLFRGTKKGKEVIQVSLDGFVQNVFPSRIEAAKSCNVSAMSILNYIKSGETGKGYKWF